jgi:hypothetical protein
MARMHYLHCNQCMDNMATTKEAEIKRFQRIHQGHTVLIGY